MPESQNRSGETPERVIAVYPDEPTARRAAEQAEAKGADVAVGDRQDEIRSMVGEMREEISESWVGPSVGLYTPEMARRVPFWTAICALGGAILAFPFGFIEAGGLSVAGRLAIAAICGAVAGGTIGFLVGGFLASRRQTYARMAGERGVVVGTPDGDPHVAESLAEDAVRVDRFAGDQAVEAISGEQAPKQSPAEDLLGLPTPPSDRP